MKQESNGKVALVTGGSRGIGAAIAMELARGGASVALNYRSRHDEAAAVAHEIRARGGICEVFAADVSRADDVERLVAAVALRFERIDIVVNNAGIWGTAEPGQNTPALFAAQFDTNVLSAVLVTQAATRHFPASGGRVVNVSSNLAASPLEGAVLYSASKAALSALTRGFAKELGPRGITVNAVAPGITATDMTSDMTPEMRNAATAQTPLRRLGRPEDIAGVVAFFASEAASWTTGQVLLVDGGLVDR